MFYQSTGSSTCAFSAVGNLLSLYGIERSRTEIRQLFTTTATDKPPVITHTTLLAAVRRCFRRPSLEWSIHRNGSFDGLQKDLRETVVRGVPALLTFHMRHIRRRWAGIHCVVVIAVDENSIHLIDSLGIRDGHRPNASILWKETPLGWSLKGAPLVMTRGSARVLHGLPRFRTLQGAK
jgi:hypothetical protein